MPGARGLEDMIGSWTFLVLGGALLLAFFFVGVLTERFRFPSALAYILLGLVLIRFSPADSEPLQQAAQIGIILLFFLRGLEFPVERMIGIAQKIWPAGLMDLLVSFVGSFFLARLFGLDFFTSFILGAVAYASSSSIIIKLMEENRRLAAPESEFILALLIFEDLAAPVIVSFMASMQGGGALEGAEVAIILLKVIFLGVGSGLLGRFLFKKSGGFFFRYLEEDFMPLFAVGWALLTAGFAMALGLSEFMGAFLAGVMLSETGQSVELDHLLLPVRNLLLPFFFFWFGSTIQLGHGFPMVSVLLALLLWSVLGKFGVGLIGGLFFGLTPLRAVRAGLSLIPRGEFSAIAAGFAAAPLRIFSGLYILCTAFMGMGLFTYAFPLAKKLVNLFSKKEVA